VGAETGAVRCADASRDTSRDTSVSTEPEQFLVPGAGSRGGAQIVYSK
jgi:hypothetical protein